MKRWIALLISLLLIATACSVVAEEDPDALCDKGVEAYKAEDYAAAFEYRRTLRHQSR